MKRTLPTAAEMRAWEQAAIAGGESTGAALMERAGAGAVEAMLGWRPAWRRAGRALVLCGPGNNGGDGYVVARLLRVRGWTVELRAVGEPVRLPPDAAAMRAAWIDAGGAVAPMRAGADGFDVAVDALFGTGLRRPLADALAGVLHGVERAGVPIVALDVPSGLQSDTGRPVGFAPSVALTVAFGALKPGHVLGEGPDRCGAVRTVPLGLEDEPGSAQLIGPGDAAFAARKPMGHKYDHGHALVLAGGVGRGGAARMAARAAMRIGAGLATLAPPPAALIENAARLDAIMLRPLRDADALRGTLDDERINALLLGPGMGTGAREAALVEAALRSGRAAVLDADALTLIAREGMRDALHDACVLTPHAGEFARLWQDLAERIGTVSEIDAAREAAARAGATVLRKGPATVVAAPDGRAAVLASVREDAVPWLATAGAGDVLAGLIAGLLARGAPPFEAAGAAAWIHAEAARRFGPGLMAEDLPDAVPGVLRTLAS
ncbi:NAD(P)H-hydrate dehydratase [Jannaschia sp. W003]|uniref:NAD(P)H-hydrate dehydratase n=1 Tax=Jannaschia sp. W003 TaxID=2867012 RepID=UPI0021A2C303|nr:NAD(P)H-hydrate dehydratase [Jannaschia sp. W003]UWQ20829.1 NAD(P)H-hydrate dehydratase [Jannaschia sp. W003]